MVEKIAVFNKNAVLSAKEAAAFVAEARKYDSDVWIEKGNKKVDGKSIMGIMALAGLNNNILAVCTEGVDEVAVADVLFRIVQDCMD